MLEIKVENNKGNHYISLDRDNYSLYPHEEEILLQSGLNAEVIETKIIDKYGNESDKISEDSLVNFNLFISDDMIKKEKRRRTVDFALPFILLSLTEMQSFPLYIQYN